MSKKISKCPRKIRESPSGVHPFIIKPELREWELSEAEGRACEHVRGRRPRRVATAHLTHKLRRDTVRFVVIVRRFVFLEITRENTRKVVQKGVKTVIFKMLKKEIGKFRCREFNGTAPFSDPFLSSSRLTSPI